MIREWDAFEVGFKAVHEWMRHVPEEAWNRPSVLDRWSVSDLAAHFWVIAYSIAASGPAPSGTDAITIGEYVSRYAGGEAEIDDLTQNAVGGPGRTVADVRSAMASELEIGREHVAGLSPERVVSARRGPLPLAGYLRTRVIEVAVHADDLARSVPEITPPAVPPVTLRLAVRTLLDVLVQKAPGRSVEVRVPPYAAVQCVAGPRHTRGTPPNVIETDPTTWLRLATGRTSWADEVDIGAVSASGERADLTAHLPLF